jgi:hypothetical protein
LLKEELSQQRLVEQSRVSVKLDALSVLSRLIHKAYLSEIAL